MAEMFTQGAGGGGGRLAAGAAGDDVDRLASSGKDLQN